MRTGELRRAGTALAWSVLVWTALWGSLSLANVAGGLVIGLVVLAVVPVRSRERPIRVRPLALLRLVAVFTWELVRASAVVAWEVVTPQNNINEGIVALPLRTRSPGLMTLIGNMITLTPGAVTLEVRPEPPTLYVHVLHLRTIDQVRADLRRLEDVVLDALAEDRPTPTPPGATS